jgi:hypothetical protein
MVERIFFLFGSWGDIGMYGGGGAAAHWRKRVAERDLVPPTNPELEETRLGLQILWGIDVSRQPLNRLHRCHPG